VTNDNPTFGARLRRHWPWLALVVFSMVVHFWNLGGRSFHHDEAIHAHSAFNLLHNGIYRYDPTYHGPLLYYLTASTYAVAGDSDFTARLPVALSGVLMVLIAWALRRPFGERAAWWMGLLVTLSPIVLYYGRFLRMDVLEMLTASATGIAIYRAMRGSQTAWLWAGLWIALMFGTKENSYVTSAVLVATWSLMLAVAWVRKTPPDVKIFVDRNGWSIVAGIAVAVLVSVPLFTVGFSYPGDWFFPGKAISYWWGQHEIARVAGPWWYHLPRLALYEFLPICLATIWVIRRRSRLKNIEVGLYLFGVLNIAMYAYLREKVPWLGVHQVWPFLPLAGAQLARTFGPSGRWWSRTLAGLGLTITAIVSLTANFVLDEITPNRDRVEALIYVQTSPEIQQVVTEGIAFRDEGVDPVAAVGGEAGWPLTWYWRATPVWWDLPLPPMRPPLVLCNVDQEVEARRRLGPGYVSERIPLRSWWLMENRVPSFGEVMAYVFGRRPWGPIGSSDIMVLRRTEGPVEWTRAVEVPAELAEALPVSGGRVIGEGSLMEPRGVAVRSDGRIAVADVGLSTVVQFEPDGTPVREALPVELREPESVAWTPQHVMVVADTWGQQAVMTNISGGGSRTLPVPGEGWYGPRGVAVAPDGTIALTDTGNKRVVIFTMVDGVVMAQMTGREGSAPGDFVEPVGIAWLSDSRRLVVCDTGNRRLQVIGRDGGALGEVGLPDAWSDFYSRPQIAVISDGLWVVSDTPGSALWIVRDGVPGRVSLADAGISPTGVAATRNGLYVSDLEGKIWIFDLNLDN
jgi:uncharacterized protein (TIGR03663 family)